MNLEIFKIWPFILFIIGVCWALITLYFDVKRLKEKDTTSQQFHDDLLAKMEKLLSQVKDENEELKKDLMSSIKTLSEMQDVSREKLHQMDITVVKLLTAVEVSNQLKIPKN